MNHDHRPTRTAEHRELWAAVNDQFTDRDADAAWSADEIRWGLFGRPETDLDVLGDVDGRSVLEIGSGTAYLSAWLARRGAEVTALDVSHHQLTTARRCMATRGPTFPLIEADGERLPVADDSFDLVVSEYGVAPWCDPDRWVPEVTRVLRADGRLVFLTNSLFAALTVPAVGGFAGEHLLRAPADLMPVTWPGGGTEFHPSPGQWVRTLTGAGFTVEALHEVYAPDGAVDHDHYEIVAAAWARRWPAEEMWVARLTGAPDPAP